MSHGCLLTTSLDGLEGPPVARDAGGAIDAGGSDALDDRSGPDGTTDSADAMTSAPIPVAPTGDVVRGLAEHGADIYWVQGDPNGGVIRAPKAGGSAPTFVHTTADAFDVAVDDIDVYWSTGTGNEVFHKSVGSSGAAALLYSGARETRYLALGAGRVYATGFNVIVVGPVADTSTSQVHYPTQAGAAGIASNGAELFWSVESGVVRGDESGQSPRTAFNAPTGDVLGVATDGQDVFWMAPDGTLRAMAVTSPVPLPARDVCKANIGDASAAAGRDVASDEAWVYFAEPPLRRISKCAKR
ncbi:MAG: hypothetical protein ABW133_20580 [Polyangiaceae bacterium]